MLLAYELGSLFPIHHADAFLAQNHGENGATIIGFHKLMHMEFDSRADQLGIELLAKRLVRSFEGSILTV